MKVKRLFSRDGGAVEIGEACTVYGMLIWNNSLSYLLSKGPHWYFADQFEIVDPTLPLVWYFTFKKCENIEYNCFYTAIWGYKELVCDKNHYIDLMEREHPALEIFFKRKEEIDEYEEMRNIKL